MLVGRFEATLSAPRKRFMPSPLSVLQENINLQKRLGIAGVPEYLPEIDRFGRGQKEVDRIGKKDS